MCLTTDSRCVLCRTSWRACRQNNAAVQEEQKKEEALRLSRDRAGPREFRIELLAHVELVHLFHGVPIEPEIRRDFFDRCTTALLAEKRLGAKPGKRYASRSSRAESDVRMH